MAHDVSTLVTSTKEKSGDSVTICEMADWDAALNKHAKEGWTVRNVEQLQQVTTLSFGPCLKRRLKKSLIFKI